MFSSILMALVWRVVALTPRSRFSIVVVRSCYSITMHTMTLSTQSLSIRMALTLCLALLTHRLRFGTCVEARSSTACSATKAHPPPLFSHLWATSCSQPASTQTCSFGQVISTRLKQKSCMVCNRKGLKPGRSSRTSRTSNVCRRRNPRFPKIASIIRALQLRVRAAHKSCPRPWRPPLKRRLKSLPRKNARGLTTDS